MEQVQELLCLAGMSKQLSHALQLCEPEEGHVVDKKCRNAGLVMDNLTTALCAEDVHDLGLRL